MISKISSKARENTEESSSGSVYEDILDDF